MLRGGAKKLLRSLDESYYLDATREWTFSHAGWTTRWSAGRLLTAVLRRRDPRVRLRTTARCQHRELFLDAAGGMHWDHIYVTQLLSNRSCRPVHDFVMAWEYVAVSRIRDALAAVPPRYLKAVKTDCVVFQDLPKKFQGLVDGLVLFKMPVA